MQTVQMDVDRRTKSFLKNIWYCAAWSNELADEFLPRKILGEPVLLFRNDEGEASAIRNLCSHKLAPLHLGKRLGAVVECGYHGLQFDGKGRCVLNPQDPGRTPNAANIRSFPLVERDEILWIWMGAPEAADESKIPNCSYMGAPDRKTIRGGYHLKGNYLLLVDNLLDLGHAYYIHQQGSGGLTNRDYEIEVKQEGDRVMDNRIARNLPGPGFMARWLDNITDNVVDYWMDMEWSPAAVLRNFVGVTPPGAVPPGSMRIEESVNQRGTHLLTPETLTTTHYFFANSRNYAVNDPEIDQWYRDWHIKGLQEEDSAMVEQIEIMREDAATVGMRAMPFLSSDTSGVMAMRVLERLLTAEAA